MTKYPMVKKKFAFTDKRPLSEEEIYEQKYLYFLWRVARKTRFARLGLNKKQTELEELGWTRRTIQRIEHGKYDITISDLLKIESTFKIPLRELLNIPKDVYQKILNRQNLEPDDYVKD